MSRFLTISNPHKITLEYDIWGEKHKESVLFIHGGGTDYHFYEDFIEELAKKYKVYAFSYPGFGKSTNIKRYTVESISSVIDSFAKAMDLKEFILVGHSLGAGFALTYTALYPKRRIAKLVLLSPFIFPIPNSLLNLAKRLTS
jgi:non-heme chloroperoxidase